MRRCWDFYGDNLLMEATFGGLRLNWSFYSILCVDGEGESIIVDMFYYETIHL